MSEKKAPEGLPEIPVAKVEFEIAKWAVDFLKHYLRFMASKETVEGIARGVFFDELCRLRDKLKVLPYEEDCEFFRRYLDVRWLETTGEQERLAELERQNDC